MNPFFELIAIAQGRLQEFSSPLSEENWKEVTLTAFKQSLGGVMAEAFFDRLPTEQFPSHQVFMAWMCMQKQVALDNGILNERSAEVYRIFSEAGFKCCILKGQAVARFYPKPEERNSGDIDIWIDGDRDAILAFLRERWPVENVVYHHAEVKMFEKTEVEVHFTPSWMYNPVINRRLQEWFRANKASQFTNEIPDLGFAAPTSAFDAVFSMVHIYRHLLEEGVGLRQVMDYYYILHHLNDDARRAAYKVLCSLRMRRFAGALMYVEKEVFALDEGLMVCAPDAKAGRFLLDEIMTAGNFGQFDPRYAKRAGEGRMKRFMRKMWRQMRFVAQYPSEVLWFPGYRLWQFCWRKIKKYD